MPQISAGPSFAKCMDALRSAVWILHQDLLELYTRGSTADYRRWEDNHRANLSDLEVENMRRGADGLAAYRAERAAVFRTQGRALVDPIMRQVGLAIGASSTDPAAIMRALYQYMVDYDYTVASDYAEFEAPGEVVGAGNPRIYRLTVDQYGYPLEGAAFHEERRFEVTLDQSGGVNAGSEQLTYTSEPRTRDLIEGELKGSAVRGTIDVDSANSGSSVLQNPSFGDVDGTVPNVDSIPGWTVTTAIGNFQLSTTTARTADTEDTAYSLLIEATDGVSQAFSVNGVNVDDAEGTPWMYHGWYRRNGGAGTLTVALGTQSRAITVTSQAGWYPWYLIPTENLYYRNWKENAPDVSISWDGTNGILIDDVYLGPMRKVGADGRHTFMSILAGNKNLLLEDYFTLQDDRQRIGLLQQWLMFLYAGAFLPHIDTGAHNIAEPSATS